MISKKANKSVHKCVMYEIRMFLVLMYPINSNMEPNPCMQSAYGSIFKFVICKDAKNTITKSIDEITDNLRLLEYLKNTRIKNMNGMNLTNSSLIKININGGIDIKDIVLESITLPPTMPICSKSVDIIKQ